MEAQVHQDAEENLVLVASPAQLAHQAKQESVVKQDFLDLLDLLGRKDQGVKQEHQGLREVVESKGHKDHEVKLEGEERQVPQGHLVSVVNAGKEEHQVLQGLLDQVAQLAPEGNLAPQAPLVKEASKELQDLLVSFDIIKIK